VPRRQISSSQNRGLHHGEILKELLMDDRPDTASATTGSIKMAVLGNTGLGIATLLA